MFVKKDRIQDAQLQREFVGKEVLPTWNAPNSIGDVRYQNKRKTALQFKMKVKHLLKLLFRTTLAMTVNELWPIEIITGHLLCDVNELYHPKTASVKVESDIKPSELQLNASIAAIPCANEQESILIRWGTPSPFTELSNFNTNIFKQTVFQVCKSL